MIEVQKKNFKRILLVAAFILLIPLVTMQFTDEVKWELIDFFVAGVLLFGAGLTYVLITGKRGNSWYRSGVGLAVITGLSLIWINLSVGIIGSEDNPANLMYAVVLIVAVVSSLFARFKPYGMAKAMFVAGIVQIIVGAIALLAEWGGTLVPDLFFTLLWMGSAFLFHRSSTTEK